jgi:Mg2+/Co2+ transporter CorB
VKKNQSSARLTSRLLERPERLIGLILIGNNFVNNLAASLATLVAIRFLGEDNIALAASLATIILTVVVLIFAEITPKTIAALYPERVAFPASLILTPLLKICYPLVWLLSSITNGLLKLVRIDKSNSKRDNLSAEELRTVVNEAGALIPTRHQSMLVNILDLENLSVDHIMVPRNEVTGIDIEENLEAIVQQLYNSQHTRLPVYRQDINKIIGILHMRDAAKFLQQAHLTKEALIKQLQVPYFIPESTPLHTQLVNFQKEKARIGLVVDEYGDVQGLVALEDILEEIVGNFTTDIAETNQDIRAQADGSYLISGSATIRDINRQLGWQLPEDGAKTLNGLVTEQLQSIPSNPVCFQLNDYYIEILGTNAKQVATARIRPKSVLAKKDKLGHD